MGFWGSLIRGAAEVAHYVTSNAGNIAHTTDTIRSFLPFSLADEDDGNLGFFEKGGKNIVPDLNLSLEKAEGSMLEKARKIVPKPSDEDPNIKLGGPFKLMALWPNAPVGEATASPMVAGDISKFLAIYNIPTTIPSETELINIGQRIANRMFPSRDGKPKVLEEGRNDFYNTPINFAHSGFEIIGTHVWYEIPVVNPVKKQPTEDHGAHSDWHSVLYFYARVPKRLIQEIAESNQELEVVTKAVLASTPYISSTIQITWTGSNDSIDELMRKAIVQVTTISKAQVMARGSTGVTFTYQFSTPLNIGPGAVCSAVSKAISDLLKEKIPNGIFPAMPQLETINSATILPADDN